MPLLSPAGFHSAWGTLWAPPLHFSRRPPQSKCPPDTVPRPDHGSRLEPKSNKGGISTSAPPRLAPQLLSLPPILHKLNSNPISGCSKAPRGLFALPRVTCIFTGTSISPDPSLRQRPDRYAIRAGRNLPDKEFRYLRTVIVTAAVYWGFDSKLAPLLLTFQHRAGVRPYTSFCNFAEPCVFDKQSLPPGLCHPNTLACGGVTLLPKLRVQFAEFLQHSSLKRLGILYLTTCVGFGYGLYGGAISWNRSAALI